MMRLAPLFIIVLHLHAAADVLPAIAPDALVVVGDAAPAAPPAEKAAAERLAAKLREAGGPEKNLVLASDINADLERAATHHLLVVGTEASNRVLQRLPSHWALDRDRYYANRQPYENYMPTKGYYAAGFGTFTQGSVGYIEWDRNPYWHYATNLLEDRKDDKPDLPYRQMVRLTGNSPEGVAMAVDAFLSRRILTGVVVADGKLPGAMSLWTIDTAHFAQPEQAPPWIPTADAKQGDVALTFAGWHIADSMTYAGFRELTGLDAKAIWRAKFLTEKKWDYPMKVVVDPAHPMSRSPLFDATLARRASDNEFFVAKLDTPEQAAEASKKLEDALSKKRDYSQAPWTNVVIDKVTLRRSRFGVHLATRDEFVVMESFDEKHDVMAVPMMLRMVGEAK